MSVVAGIVVYHPDWGRLYDNIKAVQPQVDRIIIFNNGTEDVSSRFPGITVLDQDGANIGIASALNAICLYAIQQGFDWILTLDQDSVAPLGLMDGYVPYLTDSSIALLCPAIRDRNYGSMDYDVNNNSQGADEVDACITSGSLLRLSAWERIHGFWDELFIDMVDFDLCWSLREAGYRILRVNNQSMLHEIGKAKRVSLFGKDNVIYNHSPLRCYYMIRNTLVLGRKHHRQAQCRRWALKRIILINLYEKNRWAKDRMMLKGIFDSFRFKV